jgi:hypothetical protein
MLVTIKVTKRISDQTEGLPVVLCATGVAALSSAGHAGATGAADVNRPVAPLANMASQSYPMVSRCVPR